jgi:superfamily II DNA helicase RecQ
MRNWHNEFVKYAPSVKTLCYVGKREEREALRAKIKEGDASVEFSVLITTPEMLLADAKYLKRNAWRMVVIDEAHRLKNPYGRDRSHSPSRCTLLCAPLLCSSHSRVAPHARATQEIRLLHRASRVPDHQHSFDDQHAAAEQSPVRAAGGRVRIHSCGAGV